MGNGEWGMGNGEWGMGNGEWGMGIGEWGFETQTVLISSGVVELKIVRLVFIHTQKEPYKPNCIPIVN